MSNSVAELTPDDIYVRLPDAGMRQEFLRQLNTTPFAEHEELGARWGKVLDGLQAGLVRAREVIAYQRAHEGNLPPEFFDATEQVTETRAA
jgi:hypothetical protein